MVTRVEAQLRAAKSVVQAQKNLEKLGDQRLDMVADLWKAGMSQRAIAAELGYTQSTIKHRLKKLGLQCSPEELRFRLSGARRGLKTVWTPEMVDALVHFRRNGLSIEKCAKAIGVARRSVSDKCKELGLSARV